jgi:protein gp37
MSALARYDAAHHALADLAARINAEHVAVANSLTTSIKHAIAAGDLLIEAKRKVPHGEWLPWLEYCGVSDRVAQRYMRLARNRKAIEAAIKANPTLVSDLDMTGALAAIAVPRGSGDNAASDAPPTGEPITLFTHKGTPVPYRTPKGKPTFNRTNDQVSWAAWTWNPVTGCLHGCKYCYARELATRPSYAATYPVGFTPLFHPERLDAPANTPVPPEASSDARLGRVFVCSMADLYGKWVPEEWIEQVHAPCTANPQWDYLFLTKSPRRYVGLKLPPTAWLGTSVDEQKRVRLAEEAFRQIKGVTVKWLSLEPLLAPLVFTDLSMFDWIVIGAQSATNQPDGVGHVKEFAPQLEWVARIIAQAREAGCRVYCKPNLLGVPNPQCPGMTLPQEEPVLADPLSASAPAAVSALVGKTEGER